MGRFCTLLLLSVGCGLLSSTPTTALRWNLLSATRSARAERELRAHEWRTSVHELDFVGEVPSDFQNQSRHTVLTKFVQTLEDPSLTREHWRNQQKYLQDAFVPMSALRDPVDRKVRVFSFLEHFVGEAVERCYFSKGPVDTSADGWRQGLKHTLAEADPLREAERRFNPYIFDCDEPGPEYDTFVVIAHDMVLKSVRIETVETGQTGVGWCIGPIFSARPNLEAFVRDTVARQIDKIYVYYTRQSKEALMPFNGHFPDPDDMTGPFVPFPHPQVEYIYYEAPAHAWLFGHNLVNTECLFRNRQKHDMMVVADTDEYLFWREENPSVTLSHHLRAMLPENAAALSVHTVWYPKSCQSDFYTAPGESSPPVPMNTSHMFWPNDEGVRCKSIVDPRRTRSTDVHGLGETEPGYGYAPEISVKQLYFKHIRESGDSCDPEFFAKLVNDSDPVAFKAAMNNDTAWALNPC